MNASLEQLLAPENWMRKQAGPLYSQFSQHIEEAIKGGWLSEGDSLPSERELAQISKLSRVTVRKAVRELVQGGLVIQRQGSGTSVASLNGKVEQSLSLLTSFSEDMQRRGWKSGSQWLDRDIYSPSPEEAMALGLSSESRVARISRLRLADDTPLAIERASLDANLISDPKAIGNSLYAFLDQLGKKPTRAVQRISAHNLSTEDADLLSVEEGVAGLRIERISYLSSGGIVEFTRSVYRGDAYDFVAELRIASDIEGSSNV